MKITIDNNKLKSEILVVFAFCKETKKEGKKEYQLDKSHWDASIVESFQKTRASSHFDGKAGKNFIFQLDDGATAMAVGMGEKEKLSFEKMRKEAAKTYRSLKDNYKTARIVMDGLDKLDGEKVIKSIAEGLSMASYVFDRHLEQKKTPVLQEVYLKSENTIKNGPKILQDTSIVTEAVNFSRDLVNEPPNILNADAYARLVKKDVEKLSNVQIKILGKAELQKENMNSFLSVNAGSAYGPNLVHLTYAPSRKNGKAKHIALVGKGITFDTGGYSLKPSNAMVNMKYDMAGSATVYAAFRAAVKLGVANKVSCFLGITDNAVGPLATMPDSIVKARTGKTIEILNTDAEGRLVLADVLSYACDQKPDVIIDAATLTGAVLVALGQEIAGLMSNNQKLADSLLSCAKSCDEYMWQLPIIPEFQEDMKSPIADLKNIGSNRFAGSAKAAAFLQNFVGDVPWAHLDIAGIGDGQSHLPYCPAKGASGMVVRTLVDFIQSWK
ncbi:MAG: leucyl aminopeptidase [Halobacteriovoraceae bacterium]|nr:leucyl aminopeptidase [Halobacteriovoraceae bacterium]